MQTILDSVCCNDPCSPGSHPPEMPMLLYESNDWPARRAIEVRPRALGVDGKKPPRAVYAGRLRLCLVPHRGAKTLTGFVQESIVKGAVVRTDG